LLGEYEFTRVGVPQNRGGVGAVDGNRADADADGDGHRSSFVGDRHGDGGADPPGELAGLGGFELIGDDDEFVAAEPTDQVAAAHR